MKRVLRYALCLGIITSIFYSAQAQQRYIKVYSGGEEVYNVSTSGSNSLGFSGGDAIFKHNGESTTIGLATIDSLVFVKVADGDPDTTSGNDTVAVDTASAISITWSGSTVAIVNPYASQGVTINADGGHVTVTSTLDSAYLPYLLGGTSSDGSLTITSDEVREALQEPVSAIIEAIRITLERCPPELSSDLVDRGIVLAGGTSQLRGLDKLIAEHTGLPVHVAEDPLVAVAEGTGVVLHELNFLHKVAAS